jgi:hypothetical protein
MRGDARAVSPADAIERVAAASRILSVKTSSSSEAWLRDIN